MGRIITLIALLVLAAGPFGSAVGNEPVQDARVRVTDVIVDGPAVVTQPRTVLARVVNEGAHDAPPLRVCLAWNVTFGTDECGITRMNARQPLNVRGSGAESNAASSVLVPELAAGASRVVRVEWTPHPERPLAGPQRGAGVIVAWTGDVAAAPLARHAAPARVDAFVHAPDVRLDAAFAEPTGSSWWRACPHADAAPADGPCVLPRGNVTRFTARVTNAGNAPDAFALAWAPRDAALDEGVADWRVTLRPERVALAPGESARVVVELTAPRLGEGARADFTVNADADLALRAWSATLPRARDDAPFPTVRVAREHGVDATAVPARVNASPGASAGGNLSIANTGNGGDTYRLSVIDARSDVDADAWSLRFVDRADVPAEGTVTRSWSVMPPAYVAPGEHRLAFRVESLRDATGGTVEDVTVTLVVPHAA